MLRVLKLKLKTGTETEGARSDSHAGICDLVYLSCNVVAE